MDFNEYVGIKRPLLEKKITGILKSKLSKKISLYPDSIQKILQFVNKGKLLRGVLVILSYEGFSKKFDETVLAVSAALEILHTALLIHDDIMDNDYLRRNNETVFYQYIKEGRTLKAMSPTLYGQSMGISVGDISFFLA